MRSKTAQDSCLAWILQNRFHQLLWHRRGSAVVWLSHMAKVYRGLPGTNKTSEGFVDFDISRKCKQNSEHINLLFLLAPKWIGGTFLI